MEETSPRVWREDIYRRYRLQGKLLWVLAWACRVIPTRVYTQVNKVHSREREWNGRRKTRTKCHRKENKEVDGWFSRSFRWQMLSVFTGELVRTCPPACLPALTWSHLPGSGRSRRPPGPTCCCMHYTWPLCALTFPDQDLLPHIAHTY